MDWGRPGAPWAGVAEPVVPAAATTDLKIEESSLLMENGLLRVCLDPTTGGIATLMHKSAGREMLKGGEAAFPRLTGRPNPNLSRKLSEIPYATGLRNVTWNLSHPFQAIADVAAGVGVDRHARRAGRDDVVGVRDIVQHEKTGLLAKDDQGFVSALAMILCDGSLRARLSNSAQDWAQHFDWETSSQQTLRLAASGALQQLAPNIRPTDGLAS